MDGNGRWAKQRGLPRGEGHKQGAKVFKRICEYAADRGIRYVTFYAFSTENWRRPPEEVRTIMSIFDKYMKEALSIMERDKFKMRFFAQRPLPSRMIATWRGRREKSTCGAVVLSFAIVPPAPPGWAAPVDRIFKRGDEKSPRIAFAGPGTQISMSSFSFSSAMRSTSLI